MSRKDEFRKPTLEERLRTAQDAVKYYTDLKNRFEIEENILKYWQEVVTSLERLINFQPDDLTKTMSKTNCDKRGE